MLNQTSELSARLDSYGDILTYLSTPLAAWWLWPDLINAELYYIITAIIIYILLTFFALAKLASYHVWITKISAVLMSSGVVVLLGFENNLLFHIAVYFLVIEMVENIAITIILPKPKSNIHSIWHIWKESS